MMQISVFAALAFSVVIAIFAVQNTTPVAVQFLTVRAENVAVSVLVLISAALGAGVMLLLGAAREIRLRLRHRALNQQLRASDKRVRELESQAQPLALALSQESVEPATPTASNTAASVT